MSLEAEQEVEVKHSLKAVLEFPPLCFPSHAMFFRKDARNKS